MTEYSQFFPSIPHDIDVIRFSYPHVIITHYIVIIINLNRVDQIRIRKIKYFTFIYSSSHALHFFM